MDKPNASQQGAGKCVWCSGGGLVTTEKGRVKCPKCNGTGKAPKTTTKG